MQQSILFFSLITHTNMDAKVGEKNNSLLLGSYHFLPGGGASFQVFSRITHLKLFNVVINATINIVLLSNYSHQHGC